MYILMQPLYRTFLLILYSRSFPWAFLSQPLFTHKTSLNYFTRIFLSVLKTPYKWILYCVLFCVWLLLLNKCLEIHPCCWEYNLPFNAKYFLLYEKDATHCLFSCWWTFNFWLLWIMAAMNVFYKHFCSHIFHHS